MDGRTTATSTSRSGRLLDRRLLESKFHDTLMRKRNSMPESMLRHRLQLHRQLHDTLSEQDDYQASGSYFDPHDPSTHHLHHDTKMMTTTTTTTTTTMTPSSSSASHSPSPSPAPQRSTTTAANNNTTNPHHHPHHYHYHHPPPPYPQGSPLPPSTRNNVAMSTPRKSLQEESQNSLLKAVHQHPAQNGPRRKSFDVAASSSTSASGSSDTERRHSVFGSLMNRITLPNMKKSDQKSSGSTKSTWSKSAAARLSPLMGKKSISDPAGSQVTGGGGGAGGGANNAATAGGGSGSSSSNSAHPAATAALLNANAANAAQHQQLSSSSSLPPPGSVGSTATGTTGGAMMMMTSGGGVDNADGSMNATSSSLSAATAATTGGVGSGGGGGGGGLLQSYGTGGGGTEDALASMPSNGPDNGSDTGTDEVDSGEGSSRTKQAIESLQIKIHRTKEAIKKEQNTKEAIVNEYLLMTTDKTPTPRIKALFEKKNQKSAQNINQLQRKLESYQARLQEVETHGYTGHKQAKEVLRDVGQGLKDVMEGVKKGATDTIVSKPKEFAHLIKNKFGSADNIAQLKDPSDTSQSGKPDSTELEDGATDGEGKTGGTLPASFKYGSDDENSSITSGSGLGGGGGVGIHGSPHSTHHPHPHQHQHYHQQQQQQQQHPLPPHHVNQLLAPINEGLLAVRDTNKKTNDVLQQLAEEFDDYKSQMQKEVSLLRGYLEDEKFRVERLEEQLNDLTELHQHEMHNLRQDLASTGEKIEYRLDERTTDLSDLVDNTTTRISRLEQQQQQQQILSMEMVENATFRTIISKLINVVLALLAVLLVFVSTAAHFLSPFIHSRSRLAISVVVAVLAWLLYTNYSHLQTAAIAFTHLFYAPSSSSSSPS